MQRVGAQSGGTINVANGDVAGLIAAINTLNGSGGGTITLAPGGTYTPSAPSDWWYGPNAFPAITSAIVIQGNGATIQRLTTAQKFRFFYVAGGFSTVAAGDLTLRDLTLAGGLARGGNGGNGVFGGGGGAGLGGAIFNQGTTKLITVTLAQNTAQGGNGGCCGGGSAGGGGLGGDGATTTGSITENAGGGGGFRYNGQRASYYHNPALGGDGHGTTAGGGFTGPEGGYYPGYYPNGTSPYGGNGGVGGENTGGGGGGGGGFVPGANGGNATFSTCTSNPGWNCPGGAGAIGGGRAGRGTGVMNGYGLGGGGFGGGGGGSTETSMGAGGGGVGGGGGGGWLSAGAGGWGGGGGGGYEGAPGGFAGGGGGGAWYGGGYAGGGGFAAGSGGGGYGGGGAGLGGGIFNHKGTLTVVSTTATSNIARGGNGAAVGTGFGGVIFNLNGAVTVASLEALDNASLNGADANSTGTVLFNLSHNDGRIIAGEVPTATITLVNMPSLNSTELVNNQTHGSAMVITDTAAELTPSPASLVFARQALNTTSAAQRITITNTGSEALILDGVSITGDFAWIYASTCGTVAQGQSCYIDVTFTPTAGLLRTGALVITSNALDSPRTIPLSGRGGFPGVSLSTASLSFANQLIFTSSASQRVVLTNTGQDTLNVSSIATTGQYTQVNTCSAIAPQATCNIDVRLAPTTRGNKPGMLTITDDASGSPHLVSLTGFAVGPVVTLSTPALSYNTPLLAFEIKPVVVTNVGDAPLTTSSIATAAPFSQTNNCASVPINGSCTINVKFTPASTSTVNGVLTISNNTETSPQTVALDGTGVAPSGSASPASLDFGDQAAGFTTAAQTVTVTNAGPGPLAVGPIAVTGDFQQTNNCAQVASGGTCAVNVTFKPTAAGLRTGSLTIGTNATQGVLSVSLVGNGIQPVANLSTATLSFGSFRTGGTSASQPVVIRNDGPVRLLVTSVTFDVTDYVQQNTCAAPIDVGQTCTVSVSFAPKAIGARPGRLTVVANTASALTVDLDGTGTTPVVSSATISSSANPATWGDVITLTAHLTTTPSAVPTGSVSFSDGAQALGTAAIDGTGTASITVSSLAPGTHNIFVSYPGDPVFTPVNLYATFPVTTALSIYPREIATGDFDGDGSVDLAVLGQPINSYYYEIAIVSGSTVTRYPLYYAYYGAQHLVTGDFNGDGKTDLAYTDTYYSFVYVHYGTATGLSYPNSILMGTSYYQSLTTLAAGDLNGDGKADLAASTYGSHYYALSTGGYFGAVSTFPTGLPPYSFQSLIADLNQDGVGDLIMPGSSNDMAMALSGSSWTIGSAAAGGYVTRFAAGDIDNDGKVDLVRAYGTQASYIRNLGGGTFAAPVTFNLVSYANALRIADMNGDGKADLVFGLGSPTSVATYLGDGTGQFTHAGSYTVSGYFNGLDAASVRAGTPPSVFVITQNPNQTVRLRPNSLGVLEAADDIGGGFGQTVLRATVMPAVTINDKPYDGTTGATIASRTLTGVVGSDAVMLTGGTATFADAAAGGSKTVTISGLTLAGADAAKYQLSSTTLTVQANISAATLTPVVTVSNKVYDGTTAATIASLSLTGAIGSDAVSLSGGTAAFDTPDAGPGKPVSITGLVLGGANSGNYVLGSPGAVTANITAATVNGSATAADKTYDGTTAATIATRSLDGVIGNDDVTLTGGTAAFAEAGVGDDQPVSITGLSITGAAAGNYELASSTLSASADITPAALSPIVTVASKVYDATTGAGIVTRTLSGVVSGDDVDLVGGIATFGNSNVGPGKAVTVSGLSLSGASVGNYSLSSTTAMTTADITPAPLSITTVDASRMYGAPNPVLTGLVSGVQAGDAITGSWSTTANAASAAGEYPITPGLVDPDDRLGNYNVTAAAGTLTISNPSPSLTEITPNFAATGGASVTIALTGAGFVPQSEVRWNGVVIASAWGSETGLTATVPSANLTAATVGYLTVFNAAPGGGATSSLAFLVSDSGASVAGVDTASASGGTATATTGGTGAGTPGSVSATFTGTGTVSVAQYTGNPSQASGAFRSANSYFDVYVAPGAALTSLTVVNCNLKGGNFVFWFNGSSWVRVSNQSYNRTTGCTTLHFDAETVPTVAELIATYFATAIDFTAPVSTAAASAGGAPYVFGAWTNQNVAVQLSSADAADGTGLASFTYGASGASSIAPVTSASGSAALAIASEGVTTVSFHGVDFAGNEETVQARVVRIDRTLPIVSGAATPNQLWPPNGKLVAVTISGNASDAGAGLAGVAYQVADEYGEVQPSGVATVQPTGAYSFTINLPARRDGTDKDGRIFTVTVRGVDTAGNAQTTTMQIIVPHDQGK